MTKRKATATGLAKTSGQDSKPPGALPAGYTTLLAGLKARVRAAQLRAVVSVNRELILLYWDIGRIIVDAQTTKGYGKQVVERLAVDLQGNFPARRVSRLKTSGICDVFISLGPRNFKNSDSLLENLSQKLSHSLLENWLDRIYRNLYRKSRGDIIWFCWPN
jgi:hypothetical protein